MHDLTDRLAASYDALPYRSAAFMQTAPEHLAALAHLFGLSAPPPAGARVLELGCAAGGNLIPFAARHLQASALGVELSSAQVDAGRRAIAAMGLRNVTLMQADLAALPAGLGQFDYVICHGVYSWVPEPVRTAIPRLLASHLAPDGVALVSYNTYPGWKAKQVLRDAMLLGARDAGDGHERLAAARATTGFLRELAGDGTLLAKILRDQAQAIAAADDHFLAHDWLELCNAPCYFLDFLAAMDAHGLAFLAEAEPAGSAPTRYGPAVADSLLAQAGGEPRLAEQWLDFLVNRSFRQTLLVHAERAAAIRPRIEAERLQALHLAGRFTPAGALATGAVTHRWHTASGTLLDAHERCARALLERLSAAWPGTVPVPVLLAAADHATAREQAHALLLRLVAEGHVRARLTALGTPPGDPQRPALPAPIRALAALLAREPLPIALFNAWHETVDRLDADMLALLPRLDGSHDLDALAAALPVHAADNEATRAARLRQALRGLRERAMFVAPLESTD